MATTTALIHFDRPLPEPLDKEVPSLGYDGKGTKKLAKVASCYTKSSNVGTPPATITATVMHAVHTWIHMEEGTVEGGCGIIENIAGREVVAEYPTGDDFWLIHLVIEGQKKGFINISFFDPDTGKMSDQKYVLAKGKNSHDGAAVAFALMPLFMEDFEFSCCYDKYKALYIQWEAGDHSKTPEEDLYIWAGEMCDNVYRRLSDPGCGAYLEGFDFNGNILNINPPQVTKGRYVPTNLVVGKLKYIIGSGNQGQKVNLKSFLTEYKLNANRILSEEEEKMVPVLDDSYIVPKEALTICKHAKCSSDKATRMRNFMMRGPSGTGKTETARGVAAALHLPLVHYTCSSGTEIFDLIGQVYPETSLEIADSALSQTIQELEEKGGITYQNVSDFLHMPTLEDVAFDPAGTYKELTGKDNARISARECMKIVAERIANEMSRLTAAKYGGAGKGLQYKYIETDFIKAIKYGYVVELQEPSTIMQPGVLVGLNSLLEKNGSMRLPTGEIIQRHPDTVVIVTTNVEYEGCRSMNQSVTDRMDLMIDVPLPNSAVMTERAMAQTGETDEMLVGSMVKVVCDIAEYCRKNGIKEGEATVRCLNSWITSTQITGDVYESALSTVISKVSSDPEEQQAIIDMALAPVFSQGGSI